MVPSRTGPARRSCGPCRSHAEILEALSDEVDRLIREGRWTKEDCERIWDDAAKVAERGDDFEFLHMAADPSWYPSRSLPPRVATMVDGRIIDLDPGAKAG